jgi:competence protein ComEA
VQELDALPGVGPVLAQRILDWRTENGRFTSIEELQEIKGIGQRTFAEISKHVRV